MPTAPPIRPPPVPPSSLPQYVPPSRASKLLQIASFTLSGAITVYAVLFYDFGGKDHCFVPVRRWFDQKTSGIFILTEAERRGLDLRREIALPETKTPIEFFKEERRRPPDEKLV